jgi:catechol 2,3-dioxygenase-like lactoylglutathione lyase family enzyme
MLDKAALVAFTATTDAARARTFYGDTLGLAIVEETPFAIVCDAHGTTLRIQKVESLQPPAFTALGWEVADIGATVAALAGRGVAFERYAGLSQDGRGIWVSPSGARVAWFKDPDGNTLSITQL